jgi:hypothetical protein
VISKIGSGNKPLVVYLSPDAGGCSWRHPFAYALAEFYDVWQLHYRLGHLDELIPAVLAEGRRIGAVLLDTNSYGLEAWHLEAMRDSWGAAVVQYWVDQRAEIQPEIVGRAPLIDLLLWTNACPRHADHARAAGVRDVRWMWAPSDDGVYFPDPRPKEWDVVFAGHNYVHDLAEEGVERWAAVEECCRAGLRVRVVGDGWAKMAKHGAVITPGTDFRTAAEITQTASVALSVSHFNAIEGYTSDRLLNMIFSGVPTIAKRFPGADRITRPGWCWWYDDPRELPEMVREIIADTRSIATAERASREARAMFGRKAWAQKMAQHIQRTMECRKGR